MRRVTLYECNKCHTLLHNNLCMCGNAGAITDKKCNIVYLYVDDITTVSPLVCYIDVDGVVKRIETNLTVNVVNNPINNPREYKEYARRLFTKTNKDRAEYVKRK